MMARPFRRNQLVRIGNGKKVYRVKTVANDVVRHWYYLDAKAEHPDAAKRVPDAFRWYKAEDLSPVEAVC